MTAAAFRPNTDHYDRAEARGRIAAQAVRERGGSELEAAIAQIRATFDEQLRADTLAAFKLSAAIASGRAPTMQEVADVLRTPANCPHCEFDRRFPGFERGGWIQQDNNGPIVSCPLCNPDGTESPRP
jgi:hypothetical protein